MSFYRVVQEASQKEIVSGQSRIGNDRHPVAQAEPAVERAMALMYRRGLRFRDHVLCQRRNLGRRDIRHATMVVPDANRALAGLAGERLAGLDDRGDGIERCP
jgi:hypothetical protein